jgi:hypothetical protein
MSEAEVGNGVTTDIESTGAWASEQVAAIDKQVRSSAIP